MGKAGAVLLVGGVPPYLSPGAQLKVHDSCSQFVGSVLTIVSGPHFVAGVHDVYEADFPFASETLVLTSVTQGDAYTRVMIAGEDQGTGKDAAG